MLIANEKCHKCKFMIGCYFDEMNHSPKFQECANEDGKHFIEADEAALEKQHRETLLSAVKQKQIIQVFDNSRRSLGLRLTEISEME